MIAVAARTTAGVVRGPRLTPRLAPEPKPIPQRFASQRLLTYAQVAEICAVTTRTISEAVRSKELAAVNAPGTKGPKGRRITAASLEAYLESQLKPKPRRRRHA